MSFEARPGARVNSSLRRKRAACGRLVAERMFADSSRHLARPLLLATLFLSGCGNIDYKPVGANEYAITGTASLGALGGEPSAYRLARKSSELCPDGYDIISEKAWVFEGTVIERRIRCR
jgi:hypothetical protein